MRSTSATEMVMSPLKMTPLLRMRSRRSSRVTSFSVTISSAMASILQWANGHEVVGWPGPCQLIMESESPMILSQAFQLCLELFCPLVGDQICSVQDHLFLPAG